jgi:hypothetical protein
MYRYAGLHTSRSDVAVMTLNLQAGANWTCAICTRRLTKPPPGDLTSTNSLAASRTTLNPLGADAYPERSDAHNFSPDTNR